MERTKSIIPFAQTIICNKHTENPGSGEYNDFTHTGTYLCRNCGLALFRSKHKFHSGCGWPSFDAEIANNVKQEADIDGSRTEILCARCNAHLGHIFHGEGFTPLDTRHCVNSASLDFVANSEVEDSEEAIVAGGCFWGIEYYMQKLPGVLQTEVGYSGGQEANPTYKEVCDHATGHLEAVRIVYDPKIISYEQILKYFFEIHDFTQADGQGPDIGPQYLSAIFYYDNQLETATKVISTLQNMGHAVATKLYPVTTFWPAEEYHQNYYNANKKEPYCHFWQKKF